MPELIIDILLNIYNTCSDFFFDFIIDQQELVKFNVFSDFDLERKWGHPRLIGIILLIITIILTLLFPIIMKKVYEFISSPFNFFCRDRGRASFTIFYNFLCYVEFAHDVEIITRYGYGKPYLIRLTFRDNLLSMHKFDFVRISINESEKPFYLPELYKNQFGTVFDIVLQLLE